MRRGHTRAVEVAPVSAQFIISRDGRAYFFARRYEVWLCPSIASWPTAGEEADAVGMRPEPVRGSDSQHTVGITWIRDAEGRVAVVKTVLSLKTLVAMIARCRDD